MDKKIEKLLKDNAGIRLDIGCGEGKQEGFVGMDYRKVKGVDIVHDVTKFPWPLPDECVIVAIASHLVEHLLPTPPDPKLVGLIRGLLEEKVITHEFIEKYIGEPETGPTFMRFMDEVWRVMKPDGEFGLALPYGSSPGFLQDPTHINQCNEATWWYFDPLEPSTNGVLYRIYKPKPWKIKLNAYTREGNMEVVLIKRREDRSYYEPQNS